MSEVGNVDNYTEISRREMVVSQGRMLSSMSSKAFEALRSNNADELKMYVDILKEHKENLNIFCEESGRTLLMVACMENNIGAAKILLDAGADINKREGNGITALNLSCGSRKNNAIEYLLEKSADVNVLDAYGNSSLHTYLRDSAPGVDMSMDIVKKLILAGGDIYSENTRQKTPLDFIRNNTRRMAPLEHTESNVRQRASLRSAINEEICNHIVLFDKALKSSKSTFRSSLAHRSTLHLG